MWTMLSCLKMGTESQKLIHFMAASPCLRARGQAICKALGLSFHVAGRSPPNSGFGHPTGPWLLNHTDPGQRAESSVSVPPCALASVSGRAQLWLTEAGKPTHVLPWPLPRVPFLPPTLCLGCPSHNANISPHGAFSTRTSSIRPSHLQRSSSLVLLEFAGSASLTHDLRLEQRQGLSKSGMSNPSPGPPEGHPRPVCRGD